MTLAPDVQSARRRYLLVGVVAPIVITAIAVVLMLMWLPEVPATVATHWSGDGGPDGFSPSWTVPLLVGAMGIGLPALFAAMILIPSRDGEWGPTARLVGAIALGTTTLLTVGITWSFGMQRGLDDAHDAQGVLLPLAVGAGAGLLTGVAGWFAQPKVLTSGGAEATARAVDTLDLVPGERVVWVRTTTMPRAAMLGITAGIAALALGTIALGLNGSPVWWVMLASTLVLLALAFATFVFRVRVDRAGLTVRSAIGVPRFRIPLSDIAEARVTTVQPMAEFGGWGLRLGLDGRFGVVLRTGEALQVARRNGRVFVVTVDDASTAVALLEALAAQASATGITARGA